MFANNRGSSVGEYIIVLVLIAILAIGGTYTYQKFFVKKSFETAIQSIDSEEDIASDFLEQRTAKVDNVKLYAPVLLAVFTFLIFVFILLSTLKAAKKSKRKLQDLGDDEDGQALTEFILIFPLQLFITLCIMQLSLIYTAKLVVNYAAFNAARAAIVLIPQSIGEETEGVIKLPENSEGESNNSSNEEKEMKKFDLIKRAAAISCMPVCHGAKAFLSNFSITFFGNYKITAMDIFEKTGMSTVITLISGFFGKIGDLFGISDLDKYANATVYRFIYSYLFTSVEILDTNLDKITSEKTYSRSDLVVVRVKFPYYLVIPIANNFMGKKFNKDLFDKLGLSESTQKYLNAADNQYFSIMKIDCSGYVFPISAECAMHVEMKAKH